MTEVRTHVALIHALQRGGASAGLAYLNDGVPHRYTAAYRLDGETLRNVLLHDKAGEVRPEFLAEVPIADSFCQFVLREGVFRTDDSGTDARLDGHKYQGVMVCYHGVPLLSDTGKLWGTLCHFDVAQLTLPDSEFDLLQWGARSLPRHLNLR